MGAFYVQAHNIRRAAENTWPSVWLRLRSADRHTEATICNSDTRQSAFLLASVERTALPLSRLRLLDDSLHKRAMYEGPALLAPGRRRRHCPGLYGNEQPQRDVLISARTYYYRELLLVAFAILDSNVNTIDGQSASFYGHFLSVSVRPLRVKLPRPVGRSLLCTRVTVDANCYAK